VRTRLRDGGAGSERTTHLTRHVGDHLGEPELLGLLVLHPGREPPQLAVVAVVGEPHLGADEEDLAVVDDDAAVVDDILVDDGHADVDDHVEAVVALEDLDEDLPGVKVRVACERVQGGKVSSRTPGRAGKGRAHLRGSGPGSHRRCERSRTAREVSSRAGRRRNVTRGGGADDGRDLELGTDAKLCAAVLCDLDGAEDAVEVTCGRAARGERGLRG